LLGSGKCLLNTGDGRWIYILFIFCHTGLKYLTSDFYHRKSNFFQAILKHLI
jgi:hypothetical protein